MHIVHPRSFFANFTQIGDCFSAVKKITLDAEPKSSPFTISTRDHIFELPPEPKIMAILSFDTSNMPSNSGSPKSLIESQKHSSHEPAAADSYEVRCSPTSTDFDRLNHFVFTHPRIVAQKRLQTSNNAPVRQARRRFLTALPAILIKNVFAHHRPRLLFPVQVLHIFFRHLPRRFRSFLSHPMILTWKELSTTCVSCRQSNGSAYYLFTAGKL